VLIRIEGSDMPGRSCPPGPEFPDGHHNIHVAVQGRTGQLDLVGLVPADLPAPCWDLTAQVVSRQPADLRGPQIQGGPGHRFIYLTWGVVGPTGAFTMFRRAKLWLDAVPTDVIMRALENERLVGRVSMTDAAGWPLCGSVRPPRIEWAA
jgi:hypothetical protein